MKIQELYENWGITSMKLNFLGIAEMEFSPKPEDLEVSWELYVELITRITTQPLDDNFGVEQASLNSIYELFNITRTILKEKGRKCIEFSKISIIMLNSIIRPFTTKWHKLSMENAFADKNKCEEFRRELYDIQKKLTLISLMLAKIAQIEDINNIQLMPSLEEQLLMEKYLKK